MQTGDLLNENSANTISNAISNAVASHGQNVTVWMKQAPVTATGTASSSHLVLWGAMIGGGATILGTVISQVVQFMLQKRKDKRDDNVRKEERRHKEEDWKKEQRGKELEWQRQQEAKEQERLYAIEQEHERAKVQSDIAIWRQLKLKLDHMHWEINKMRPGAQPSEDGQGLVYVSYVSPPHKDLITVANEILKISYSVKFHDEESENLLNSTMAHFKEFVGEANMEAQYRHDLQQRSKWHLAPDDSYQKAKAADERALEILKLIDQDYEDIKDLIRRKFGYHSIYDTNG